MAIHGSHLHPADRHKYTPDHIRRIQVLEDELALAIKMLTDNIDILTSLGHYYYDLTENQFFPLRDPCGGQIAAFCHEVGSVMKDMNLEQERCKNLARKTADRKSLVGISDGFLLNLISTHLNTHLVKVA
jgi:hypothetical protein